MAHRVSLPRSVITLLAVAALMALTALAAAVARPVPADAASAIVIGNGDVAALEAAISSAPSGTQTVIDLAADGTYTLTQVDNTTDGPTGLPLAASGADVVIRGDGATIERSDAAGTPDFTVLTVPAGTSFTLDHLTVSGGLSPGSGGGIEDQGNLTLNGSTVSGNTADGSGGGIDDASDAGALTITHSTISGNSEDASGTNSEDEIYGGGGINDVSNGGDVTITNSTVSGNTAAGDGGGFNNGGNFADDNISDSTFSGNTGYDGGGIFILPPGGLIFGSTFSANTATDAGGGLYLYASYLLSSTVSGNTTSGSGGGVYLNPGYPGASPVMEHDTITLNSGHNGSGMSVQDSTDGDPDDTGIAAAGDCIISGNIGDSAGNGTNVGGVNDSIDGGGEVYFSSMGYNLIGYSAGSVSTQFGQAGDQRGQYVDYNGVPSYLGVNAWLGPLRDNGGPAKTQLPGFDSPAIDAGDQTLPNETGGWLPPPPATDQRGLPRVVTLSGYPDKADGSDIGSVELQSAPVESLVVSTTGDTTGGGAGTSLREALDEALAAGGGTITFDIPGPGPHVIRLKSALPEIPSSITLDNASGAGVVIQAPTGDGPLLNFAPAAPADQLSVSGLTLRGSGSSGYAVLGGGGSVDITDSVITGFDASAVYDGSAISLVGSSLTLSDSEVTGNQPGALGIAYPEPVTISGSTFSGNHSGAANSGPGASGGAIDVDVQDEPGAIGASITDSVFSGNSASDSGGAISDGFQGAGMPLSIADSTFSRNTAAAQGGALAASGYEMSVMNSTLSGNTARQGGAIANDGTLAVTASTLSGNSATDTGGGIFSDASMTMTNSTMSGNKAGAAGGALYQAEAIADVSSSTLTGNTAPYRQGGGIATFAGDRQIAETRLTNSIVDGNHGGDVFLVDGAHHPGFISRGYNMIDTSNQYLAFDQPGDQVEVTDPMLGPLAANGGPTKTIALLPGSPAIGTGGKCPATDQRGYPRPRTTGCDIGAFQVQAG